MKKQPWYKETFRIFIILLAIIILKISVRIATVFKLSQKEKDRAIKGMDDLNIALAKLRRASDKKIYKWLHRFNSKTFNLLGRMK